MRIDNINKALTVEPLTKLQNLISDMQVAESLEQLNSAEKTATTYLSCLNDTQYITTREHFEFKQEITQALKTQREELNK